MAQSGSNPAVDAFYLLDRVSSCMQSPNTLSSSRLFFSWIRPGNVEDLFDADKPFELEHGRGDESSEPVVLNALIVIAQCSSMRRRGIGVTMREFEGR